MSLKVEFGNGSTATTLDLDNAVSSGIQRALALSSELQGTSNGSGSTIPVGQVAVGTVATAGSGTGGTVSAAYDVAKSAFSFDVDGAWNSVKNVFASSTTAENIVLKDFVNANVKLGGSTSSYVEIHNVKRGIVETGDGNDTVKISLLSNDAGWTNEFVVKTGAGNDTIVFSKGGTNADAGGGAFLTSAAKNDGSLTSVFVDAGSGDDVIDLRGTNIKEAILIGGAGDDKFYGGNGKEIYKYTDTNSGNDVIQGFTLGQDKIDLSGLGLGANDIDFEYSVRADTLTMYFGDTSIAFRGVGNINLVDGGHVLL